MIDAVLHFLAWVIVIWFVLAVGAASMQHMDEIFNQYNKERRNGK